MNMQIFEVLLKVYTLQEINRSDEKEKSGYFIDQTLLSDGYFKKFHESVGFKYYSFNTLYPFKNEKYEKGNVYELKIRTVDYNLANFLLENLPNTTTKELKGLEARARILEERPIEKLYSLSPIIVKTAQKKYWKECMNVEEYMERIKINLIKKYNSFFNTKIDENFELFTSIVIKNKCPIGFKYKGIKLPGDKIELTIAVNEQAQKLANFAQAVALGDLGPRGAGFVNAKYIK
ncbi:hypothetical protein KGNDJEFE_02350 [Peptacetobacter hiranonis]|nr:hypothetical protein KGNDJEFE_02350 [Peptacetobacter hiranonis]